MGLLRWHLKRRAIKGYLAGLPHVLRERYAPTGPYSLGQIRRSMEDQKLSTSFIPYAVVIFGDAEALDEFNRNSGEAHDYQRLRRELVKAYYLGSTTFTVADVFKHGAPGPDLDGTMRRHSGYDGSYC